MSAHVGLIYLMMAYSFLGSLLGVPQQARCACLFKPLLVHGAGIRSHSLLEQEGGPEFAVFLLQYRAKPPASASDSRSPVVASIPLSSLVPASRIHFSIGRANGVPALLVTSGRKALTKPLIFSALLTNPVIWNHS